MLLSETEETAIIQMVEAAYLAACRSAEGRLGEAITLAWGVCEQLLSISWKEFIAEASTKSKITGKRRKNLLEGRDYTASVKTEILELNGRFAPDLYSLIDNARKARNDWMHEMKEPNNVQVLDALHAAEGLLQSALGIQQVFPMHTPSPGIPALNYWVWRERQG